MMDVPIDEVVYFDVITSHPSTGAVTDADSTPTFAVYEEATDTDIGVGGNLTKRTSLTGNYRGSFTVSEANGFEAGKWYSVIASATVNSISGKAVAHRFRAVANDYDSTLTALVASVATLAGKFTGITSLANWLGAIAAKHTADGTAITEINATGGGSGTFTAATDSQEAIRDTAPLGTAMRGTDGAYTGTPPTVEAIRVEIDANSTKLADIVADTNDLQTNQGNWLTATGFAQPGDKMDIVDAPNAAAVTAIQSGLATTADVATVAGYVDTEVAQIITDIGSLNNISTSDVLTQVAAGLAAIHLDHLLAAAYDPASKPGDASGLLNVMIGNDGGVPQFTANALELGPSGSSTVNILPVVSTISAGRVTPVDITMYNEVSGTVDITCYQSDGSTAYDLTGLELTLYVEDIKGENDIFSIANANITITGDNSNIARVAYTSTETDTANEGTYQFALRRNDTNFPVAIGRLSIEHAAITDS